MAVITNKTNYKAGDTVTAEIVNDTIETAIAANATANEASQFAESAKIAAQKAQVDSQQAKQDSTAAKNNAEQAKADAQEALEKANDVAAQAQRGDFNGTDGVVVPTNGIFGLQIVDGNLILSYEDGTTPPNLRIDAEGNLIYEY